MNERQLRHVIRQVILETPDRSVLREYDDDGHGKLYTAFVQPFADVAQAVKLTSQDILNTFGLVFTTLTTLSPKKLVDAREEYLDVKDDLDKEWQPLMDKAKSAIENSDVGIASLAMAPSVFFTYQFGKFAKNAPGTVADYFEEAGWSIPFKDIIDATPDEETESGGGSGRSGRSDGNEYRDAGVLGKLRIFFFGESLGRSGNLIVEKDNKKEDKKNQKPRLTSSNIDDEVQKYFKQTGADKRLKDLGTKMLDAKKKHATALRSAAEQQINALKSFSDAQTLEQFEAAVKSAAKMGVDVKVIQQKIDKLKQDIEKKAKELETDDKFKESIKKQAGGKEITDKQMQDATKKSAADVANKAIVEMKKEISSSLKQAMSKMKKQILDELTEGLPDPKDPLYAKIMSTPMGKKLQAILDEAVTGLST